MDEYIRKSDAIEQALDQIHRLDITVRERILNFDGKAQAKTNADRIRRMSDEELAEFIAGGFPKDVCRDRCGGDESFPCSECVLDWLREEVSLDG